MTQVVTIALAADGRSWVDGTELKTASDGTLASARAIALEEVRRLAQKRRRPVRVDATDPDGARWLFLVDADGQVHEPEAAPLLPDDPDAYEVPAEHREAVAEVIAAIAGGQGREHVAIKAARQMEEDLAARHGQGHPYVLRALELRAHAVYACGMPSIGCELYLDAAEGWRLLGSPAQRDALQRAYALWHRIADEPSAGTVWLGQRLVDALRQGGPQAQPAIRAVLAQIDRLRLE
ncbi:hypothetical protein [Streptomyces sp. NPDC047065]|uniref:hypothetical protein n=1 Tax=Streptomyces sp. NPDC047065 TaxID=3154606 RepID=UPI0033F2B62B